MENNSVPIIVEESVIEVIDLDYDEAVETAVAPIPPTTPEPPGPTLQAVQSITRLLVGGALEGSDELFRRLRQLEEEVAAASTEETAVPLTEDDAQRLRYALIGLLFEGQQAVRKKLPLMKRIGRLGFNAAILTADALSNNRVGRAAQRRAGAMATRGENAFGRWITRGRQEETAGRQISLLLFSDIIDDFIGDLAENEEIGELVTQQSMGLASEIIDEVREQTVTADTLIERVARAILRRPPRVLDFNAESESPTIIDEDGNLMADSSSTP